MLTKFVFVDMFYVLWILFEFTSFVLKRNCDHHGRLAQNKKVQRCNGCKCVEEDMENLMSLNQDGKRKRKLQLLWKLRKLLFWSFE